MLKFIEDKFIYLLVSFWMLVFTYAILHLIHRGGDPKALDWSENAFSALLGALLGLIQGRSMANNSRVEDKSNGNGQTVVNGGK